MLECVLCRSDGEAVAVNLDIEPVEKPENVRWIDPIHRGMTRGSRRVRSGERGRRRERR